MDAQSGPGTPESLSNEHFAWESIPRESTSYPGHDNMSYEDAEEPWWEAEIENLKSNLKALNIQMFEQKKQWLAEKTALEAAAAAAGPGYASSLSPTGSRSFNAVGSLSGGGGRIDSGLSRSAGLARNGTLLERSPGLDRAGVFQDDPSVLRGQLQAANSALAAMTAERDAARQEVAVMKSQAQRWNVERASLQREVEVLRASQGATGIPASGMRTPVQSNNDEELLAALAAAEEEKAALMAELDTVKQSLKSSMQVHKNHVAQITGGVGGQAAMNAAAMSAVAAMGRGPTNASPRTTTSTNGADPSATIARLNAEITRLQADLYIIKDECVPVPKAEFASLKGIHTEKASTEQELRAVRQELADVTRLNKMLREEMELIKEEHIAITMQEYDELRRAAAEKQALELKLEAQAKYYAQVPKEELEEMKAARRAVAGLETRLAAMQAVTVVAQDDTTRALALASNEAADLRIKLMETEATSNELRRELAVAEGRATVILELQEKLRTAEASLVAAQQEKARAALRLRALEEELTACKSTMQQAQEESARLAKDLASVRDTCSGLAQEVSTLTRERGELEARLGESRSEREKVTNDLVDAKLELARLREMEVHFRKKVLTQQKALYGLPSTYESG